MGRGKAAKLERNEEIRAAKRSGKTYGQLKIHYKISKARLWAIVNGK